MSVARVVCIGLLLFSLGASAQEGSPGAPANWDARFRELPQARTILDTMRRLSARPHHVGSPYDKDNAEWLAARFREFGWDARIETFDVLFPTPKERRVELLECGDRNDKSRGACPRVLSLAETAVPQDPTSSQQSEQLPSYNAYSRDGDVTGRLVYVNYGRPEDYEVLDRYGIDVKGAIVLARYGRSWRGIKPKVAAEKGAIGCLIYSDPHDDGYFAGDVYPEGPMRPPQGVQRGSVMDMPVHPGDPLTPGVGATGDVKRLALADAATITRIPVLPISYADAQPLLAAIRGPLAPVAWRGALPITYHLGPGPATIHVKLAFNWTTARLYNVIARLEGSTAPDEWIIRGNHHDGWVNGASDPSSGMAPLLEEARALGMLKAQGWRPRRTIVYTAWDGEEPALLGSTEWVEQHDADLSAHAVVYINSDGNGRGFLQMGGSHTLERFVNEVARDLTDPEADISVWKRLQASIVAKGSEHDRKEARQRSDLRLAALGSGSDYTPFLQHAGVAALDIGYGGEDDDNGVYHSIYDDYAWYSRFSDVDGRYGRLLAQTIGTMVVRLADADLLPFDFTAAADTAAVYVTELQKLLADRQKDTIERNRQLDEGVFAAVNDPRRPQQPPRRDEVPPAINFAPLQNAAVRFTAAARRYAKARAAAASALAAHADVVQAVNARLRQSERQFLDPAGLPGRPWYRHLLYAPGFYTGYGVKTMPGVREGIEQRQYGRAEREVVRVAAALDREAALANAAAEMLEGIVPPGGTPASAPPPTAAGAP